MAEVGALGNITARYLRGAKLICREQDGAAQYYLFDAHGDVVQRMDMLGNLLKNYRYDAYLVFINERSMDPMSMVLEFIDITSDGIPEFIWSHRDSGNSGQW